LFIYSGLTLNTCYKDTQYLADEVSEQTSSSCRTCRTQKQINQYK